MQPGKKAFFPSPQPTFGVPPMIRVHKLSRGWAVSSHCYTIRDPGRRHSEYHACYFAREDAEAAAVAMGPAYVAEDAGCGCVCNATPGGGWLAVLAHHVRGLVVTPADVAGLPAALRPA
jgi:hypothetical protein